MSKHTVPTLVHHRTNDSKTLCKLANRFGVEVDLRTREDTIVVAHDLHSDGEPFAEWIRVTHTNC